MTNRLTMIEQICANPVTMFDSRDTLDELSLFLLAKHLPKKELKLQRRVLRAIENNFATLWTPEHALAICRYTLPIVGTNAQGIKPQLTHHGVLLQAFERAARGSLASALHFYINLIKIYSVIDYQGNIIHDSIQFPLAMIYLHGCLKYAPIAPSLSMLYNEAVRDQSGQAYLVLATIHHLLGQACFILMPTETTHVPVVYASTEYHEYHWRSTREVGDLTLGFSEVGHRITTVFGDIYHDYAAEIDEMCTLIEDKFPMIEAMTRRMWQDLSTQPSYDVRLGGNDTFAVSGVLGAVNGRTRIFVREYYTFPTVGILNELNLRVADCLIPAEFNLENMLNLIHEQLAALIEVRSHHELARANVDLAAYAKTICIRIADTFVNLLAYHDIVCRPKSTDGNDRIGYARQALVPTKVGIGTALKHMVRPHFRKLQPGWNPSEEKREEALARLGHLPAGYTFVTDHERHAAQFTSTPKSKRGHQPMFVIDPLDLLRRI